MPAGEGVRRRGDEKREGLELGWRRLQGRRRGQEREADGRRLREARRRGWWWVANEETPGGTHNGGWGGKTRAPRGQAGLGGRVVWRKTGGGLR